MARKNDNKNNAQKPNKNMEAAQELCINNNKKSNRNSNCNDCK